MTAAQAVSRPAVRHARENGSAQAPSPTCQFGSDTAIRSLSQERVQNCYRLRVGKLVRGQAAESLVDRVRETIRSSRLIQTHDRVVVGVSGGPDSITLLHVLVHLAPSLGLKLYVVHVDHQLRSDSAADAAFVRELAGRFQVPAIIERRAVRAICQQNGWSLEDGARRVRYECFLDAARRYSAPVIALAHTADDQAETVAMRLLRGSGVTGLSGIPAMRQAQGCRIVRPLLAMWRDEVMEYVRRHRLTYRRDLSNDDPRFVRNRIRHQLLPLLAREFNPNIKAALVQLAQQCRGEQAYLQAATQRLEKRCLRRGLHGRVSLTLRSFARQPEALQRSLVREAIRQVRGDLQQFEYRHWLEVERLWRERPVQSVVDLPGGIRVSREHECLVIQRKAMQASPAARAGSDTACPRTNLPTRHREQLTDPSH